MDKICYDKNFFDSLIKDSSNYYAHLPKDDAHGKAETLAEHSGLTYAYALSLMDALSLRPIVVNLINLSIPKSLSDKADFIADEMQTLFAQSIAFHDLGKVNHKYQQERMRNHSSCLKVDHQFGSSHAAIGMYLFLAFYYKRTEAVEDIEIQKFLDSIAAFFSYIIHQHHHPILIDGQRSELWDDEQLYELSSYLPLFGLHFQDVRNFHDSLLKYTADRFSAYNDLMDGADMPTCALYALLKLNYSLLTASDYLATAHFMNGWTEMVTDFGVIDDALRNKIARNASVYKYNKQIYENLQTVNLPDPDSLHASSNANLNTLRQSLAIEAIRCVRSHPSDRLFYLEAPTGSGKTNVSLLAASELLASDRSLNKIFYVFPFTTLITQTYRSLQETLDLDSSEMAEVHSKSFYKTGRYDEDYKNYIGHLLANYPIVLLSHVRFFDILKTNNKETNYMFGRLANSIVIIDEMQSYNPSTWNVISYFIVHYAAMLNMKFVIMSATLPKIGYIINEKNFVFLLEDKNKYFLNPNFRDRVKFDYSLLSMDMPRDADERACYLANLKSVLQEKSSQYASANIVNPDSVHTIIEFIYKKTASEFYALFENNDFFDEVFLLSGTILEPRRRDIIRKLKSEEYRKKKILLISTQVVEAGVDIDMDMGFKDKSLIDSDEQLAGRVNRNVKKNGSMLYLFNCDAAKSIYGDDERYKLMRDMDPNDYRAILEQKDFDRLYEKIIDKIRRSNGSRFMENIDSLKKDIKTLNYSKVNSDLELIENSGSISVFVPLKLDVRYFGELIDALECLSIKYDDTVDGRDVWEKYESLIRYQDFDFVRSRISMKRLQGIMSFYIFSIFSKGKDFELLRTYGEEKYGFFYLENFPNVYSLENGINTRVLSDSIYL